MEKRNNFDIIRLALAFMVLLYHCYALSRASEISWFPTYFQPLFAVQSFFVVSGFLIFMSCANSTSVRSYAIKRGARIFPAYATTIILASVIGLLFSEYNPAEYLTSPEFRRYLGYNLAFLNYKQPDLPGLFSNNPIASVNGALWTIKVELAFYIAVPFIFLAARKMPLVFIAVVIYIASVAFRYYFQGKYVATGNSLWASVAKQFPGQLCYFMAGATAFLHVKSGRKISGGFAISAIVIYFLCRGTLLEILVSPALVAVVVFYLALHAPYIGFSSEKFGDLSYGLYIYHFPIIQLVVQFGLFERSPYLATLVSIVLTVCFSIISWKYIEKPSLDFGHSLSKKMQGKKNKAVSTSTH